MISTFAPSALQNARSFSTASGSAPSGGVRMHQRLTNSSGKPESGPGILGAGDRMRRDEMHACRHLRRHVLEHRVLDRADIRDDRAGLERAAISAATGPLAPTGMQTMTRSAPFAASALVSTT
jgi:hypothetical protein